MERRVLSGSSVFDINMSEIKCDMGGYDTVLRTNGLKQRELKKSAGSTLPLWPLEADLSSLEGSGLGGNNLGSGIRPGFGCGLCHLIAMSLWMRLLIPLSLSFFIVKQILQVTLEDYPKC